MKNTSRVEKNKQMAKIHLKQIKQQKKEIRKKRFHKIIGLLLIITAIIMSYAYFIEPNLLKVTEIKIENKNIPENFHGTKIVHFNGLNYGTSINEQNIENIINKINILKPDIVIFTGNLINKNYTPNEKDKTILEDNFKNINSKLGKYILKESNYKLTEKQIIENSNFIILENTFDKIYNSNNEPILIYGNISTDNIQLDEEISKIKYKILINNNISILLNERRFNLIFTNENENILKTINNITNYKTNHYKLENINIINTNNIGSNITKIRIGDIPNINLIRLSNK